MRFLLTIFLSAFLLFQVQPIIAKQLLPHFGGGSAVWTACMLFFQTVLLLGYLYAHYLTQIKSLKKQLIIHVILVLVSLCLLPLTVNNSNIDGVVVDKPLLAIMVLLAKNIGIQYFLLTSTAPLLQRWLSMVNREALPYKLYSLSNAASLLALLSFPFFIEPLLSIDSQKLVWSILFILFNIGLLFAAHELFNRGYRAEENINQQTIKQATKPKINTQHLVLWLFLSALGVVLLISTTNAISQNVPPVPFLWLMPLCLYLLTFIICFHSHHWYKRWYLFVLFSMAALAGLLLYFIGSHFVLTTQIIIYALILFSGCMICHGELVKLKPNVEQLTLFYLIIALGGFLGSIIVTLLAPLLFKQFDEYPLAIIFIFVLFAISLSKDSKMITFKKRLLQTSSMCIALLLSGGYYYVNQNHIKTNIYSERNFYGIISVKDIEVDNRLERRLIDGTTSHGTQSLPVTLPLTPRSYYRKNSGIGLAISVLQKRQKLTNTPFKMGVIGLGAGTLAAYGQADDQYDFYELNPAVINVAKTYFSYLTTSAATNHIIQGDARVNLTRKLNTIGHMNYDLLVVDAFSGDAVPQHLLTIEAFQLYFKHIRHNGIVAVHVSNSHLNLVKLVQDTAIKLTKSTRYFFTKANGIHHNDAQWLLLANNDKVLDDSLFNVYKSTEKHDNLSDTEMIVWTDEHSHLLSILK